MDDLQAVRDERWKLHVARGGAPVCELYDLATDPGETTDVASRHPDIVRRLEAEAERYRADLGDARLGIAGTGVRPVGRVSDPTPLTTYDPSHPDVIAAYDLPDRG